MADEDGYYEQVGDVQEWRWHKGKEPKVNVPEGEFDPRSADKAEPEKAAPKKVTTKTAEVLTKKKR